MDSEPQSPISQSPKQTSFMQCRADSIYNLAALDQEPGEPITIFFKVRERVKKALFSGRTLDDVNKLFLEKFPDFPKYSLRPFTIMHLDAQVPHELDDVEDLYSNCILEIKYDAEGLGQKQYKKSRSNGLVGREREKIVLVMVGLPARGKTYIAKKICNMLCWLGVPTKVFNVGQYRRERIGLTEASFFDPDNKESQRALLHLAVACLDDLMSFLSSGGMVGIYDGANITAERRRIIAQRCTREGVSRIIFIESICDDQSVIEANIRETKLTSPDSYPGQSLQDIMDEVMSKVKAYTKAYETIPDSPNTFHPYIKIFDGGRKIITHKIQGFLPGRIIFFLMNLRISARPVWMTSTGETDYDIQERLGGDAELTGNGDNYAHRLAAWVDERVEQLEQQDPTQELTVWTSTLKRSVRTAQYIPHPKVQLRGLDDLERGLCDGMTMNEFAQKFPEEFAARAADKLPYRWPRGESYEDVISRLEPVIFELERSRNPILIVSHPTPLRFLYAYLMGLGPEEAVVLKIAKNTVFEILPTAYNSVVKFHTLM